MLAALAPFFLKLSPVGNILKAALGWLWRILVYQFKVRVWMVALALFFGLRWHDAQVKKHVTATSAAWEHKLAGEQAKWQAAFDKEHAAALLWEAKTAQEGATIAADERKINEEAVASNAAAADALRLRGPGKAAARCGQGNNSAAAAAAGGSEQAAPAASAPASQVPAGEWATVPWNWFVTVLQEHDDMRAELQAIFDNDRRQRAAWPTKDAPKPPPK